MLDPNVSLEEQLHRDNWKRVTRLTLLTLSMAGALFGWHYSLPERTLAAATISQLDSRLKEAMRLNGEFVEAEKRWQNDERSLKKQLEEKPKEVVKYKDKIVYKDKPVPQGKGTLLYSDSGHSVVVITGPKWISVAGHTYTSYGFVGSSRHKWTRGSDSVYTNAEMQNNISYVEHKGVIYTKR